MKDAAARLPASIGTKADIYTLVRDSQFIMENVSDLQVNQVVSRALDRLHNEKEKRSVNCTVSSYIIIQASHWCSISFFIYL